MGNRRRFVAGLLFASLLAGGQGLARARGLDLGWEGSVDRRDLGRIANQMARDLLTRAAISHRGPPPRIILDSADLRDRSAVPIDKDFMVDQLRSRLEKAARGKLRFVSRDVFDAVEHERALKREGVVDVGTVHKVRLATGIDYKLVGKITSLDSRNDSSGMEERFTMISLELLDLEDGTIVWNGTYKVRRADHENLYR